MGTLRRGRGRLGGASSGGVCNSAADGPCGRLGGDGVAGESMPHCAEANIGALCATTRTAEFFTQAFCYLFDSY